MTAQRKERNRIIIINKNRTKKEPSSQRIQLLWKMCSLVKVQQRDVVDIEKTLGANNWKAVSRGT